MWKKIELKCVYYFVNFLTYNEKYAKLNYDISYWKGMTEMKKFAPIIKGFNHLVHGADYNPDQWIKYDKDIIDKDMRLLKLANMNSVSAGIFAWSTLEPEEGKFNFSFLDEVMDKVAKVGGKVILATPSGARPRWLAKKYPEVLRTNEKREKNIFGERHNHCFTSPVYREKVAIINEKLAERYKNHEALGLWHISNEFGGSCHCPMCQEAFREWLKEKYDNDLEKLNYEYWSDFWSHTYTSWDQIESPSSKGDMSVNGLSLDWKRFTTHQTAEFFKAEIEPLKRITPDVLVTTNHMRYTDVLDYFKFSEIMDVVSWDDYPSWQNDETDIDLAMTSAMWHDVMRGMKQKPFFLMESTPSMVNWKPLDKIKRPGMNKATSLLAVAHGSDSVQYFQFRKSRNCTEQHHGAVVDHCGHENTRVFREVSELGAAMKKMDDIVGSYTKSEVGFVYDWENRWALEGASYFKKDKKYDVTLNKHYNEFYKRGINVDFLSYKGDFSPYKLIVIPMMYSVPEFLIKKIEEYVKGGGCVVTTYASAMVNENCLAYLGGWPANELKDVFGVWNEEISCMADDEKVKVSYNGKQYDAVDYCEVIHETKAEVLGRYEEDYFKGMPAVCKNQYGDGQAYYIAFRDNGDFLNDFYGELIEELKLEKEFLELPYGVTVAVREDENFKYVFIHNFAMSDKTVKNNKSFINMETEEKETGNIFMPARTCKVLKLLK